MMFKKPKVISILIIVAILLPIFVHALGLATIQLKITDNESGINEILLPDGTTTTDTDIKYAITKNGFYKFTAYDKAGNISQEFVIEVSDINKNTNMDEIEDIINEAGNELNELLDEDEKNKLEEQLNKLKEDYDEEIKSRIDYITESISNMVSVNEKEIIEYEISRLPEKYQSNKYTPSLEEEKVRLNQKLQDKINELVNKNKFNIAKNAVEKAERTLNQEDLDNAWVKVKLLPEGRHRDELSDRLNIVQELIFAIEQIEKDIDNMKSLEEKFWIQNEIDRLPDGSEKVRLQKRLDSKVRKLERLEGRDKAQDLIDEREIEDKDLEEAIKAVERAEVTLGQKDLDSARVKVNKLPTNIIDDSLNKRLDLVQNLIDEWKGREDLNEKLLEEASDAVKKAEVTIKNEDIQNAKNKINQLPDSPRKDILKERIELIEKIKTVKEESKEPEPEPEKPKAQTSKPTNNNSRPLITSTATATNKNHENNYNIGSSDNDSMENEKSVDDNLYYKKPIRNKQTNFFKLKEPEIVEKIAEIEENEQEEIEDIMEGVVEEIEPIKTKKSKLPLIIILLLITGLGVGVFFFIRNKKQENEDSDDQ